MPIPTGGLPILGTLYPSGALPIIDPQGGVIPNVGTPVAGTDAVNKNYVDSHPTVLTAYANIAAVIATDWTGVPNGTFLGIVTPDDIYELLTSPSAAIIAATDGVNIIQPTTPNTVRIVRKGYAASYVSDWYVDTAAGSDTNDGLTSGTALKTLTEWQNRFNPFGQRRQLFQATTLHIAAGTYSEGLSLNHLGATFTVQGSFTVGSNITLAAGTANASAAGSGTRAQVVTASGTFAVGQRLRCVSGSNVGATCYVQALNGDAQHAFVTPWVTPTTTYRATTVTMAVGDVVVVETNTTFTNSIEIIEHNVGALAVLVRNISGTGGLVSSPLFWSVKSAGVFLGVIFDLCQGFFESSGGNAYFMRCQGGWYQTGGLLGFQGGNRLVNNYIWQDCLVKSIGGDSVELGLQVYNCTIVYGSDDAAGVNTLGIQFENIGAGACFQLGSGTKIVVAFNMALWGVTGAATGSVFGFTLGGGTVLFGQALLPTVNALKPIVLPNGDTYTFAQAPVRDFGSNSFVLTNASPDARAQLATHTVAVTPTNLYAANPPKGQYKVSGYLSVTTIASSPGQMNAFVTYTDDNGVAIKRALTSLLSGAGLDSADGLITIRTNGSSQVQWSVEAPTGGTFPSGGGFAYEFSLTCERGAP